MLDLINGTKIIAGMQSTAIVAGADWINTENLHVVWAVVTMGAAKPSSNFIQGEVAESYAGASNSLADATYWSSTTLTHTSTSNAGKGLTKSTATTGTLCGTSASMVVCRFDPATADTSDHFFRIATPTSGWGINVTYICEPRYAGYKQFIATTSST